MESSKHEGASPREVLEAMAAKQGLDILTRAFAEHLDNEDPLRAMRDRFLFPRVASLVGVDQTLMEEGEECVYMCGNSLGLQPRDTRARLLQVLDDWAHLGVESHFFGSLPAATCDTYGREEMGRLVGASPSQVAFMNGLTVNLHLLLLDFYKPTPTRYKIVIEGQAFPSDRYAVKSQVRLKGLDPDEAVIQVQPRPGEHTIRTEDLLKLLKEEGPSIAVVCLSGVQYYTGQKFDMALLTAAGREQGCVMGWDLAHAVGNVEVKLDEWGVDFACWCTYKYLNSGPGAIAGAYINARHNNRTEARLEGWWSNKLETRFEMREDCDRAPGIDGFSLSNTPPLLVGAVLPSLKIFDEVGMPQLLQKQYLLTGYLELLILHYFGSGGTEHPSVTIITPDDPEERGCQLSLTFAFPLNQVKEELTKRGVLCDVRLPSVIRIAPAPLYNSFVDVYRFISILQHVFDICKSEAA